jgi:AraC-like DNA-binding protein
LNPASALAEFTASPAGQSWRGDGFVYWCAQPTLYGFALGPRPTATDLERLCTALLVELGPPAVPHASLVDASLVAEVDPMAFEVLQRYVKRNSAKLATAVTKLALVRPPGLPGAVVAGFYSVLDSPYPTQVFDEVGPALAWLGVSSELGAELEALRDELTGVAPLVAQLRRVLAADGADLSANDMAKRLGLSQRTLQRRLSDAGTSVQRELSEHRLRAAQRALDGDAPITTIAFEAGYATPQHFSTAFKKFSGLSPTEWRTRARKTSL